MRIRLNIVGTCLNPISPDSASVQISLKEGKILVFRGMARQRDVTVG